MNKFLPPSLIVFYNTGFGVPLSFYYPYTILEGTTCELSADQHRIKEADAVVFHLPNMGDISHLKKKPDQLWVVWSQECDQNYPVMLDKEAMSIFDLRMTYHLDADVSQTYFSAASAKTFRDPIPEKSSSLLATAFISSTLNISGRLEYLKDLMQHMEVHSYGKTLRTKALISDLGRKSKMEILGKYKFTLAFENACGKDYVTEKFYDAFRAGTVPVYMGAPNIEELAPGEHCYINVSDFESPEALANYLHKLNEDDTAYYAYFEWKNRPFKEPFNTLIDAPRVSLFHRLYHAIRKRRSARD